MTGIAMVQLKGNLISTLVLQVKNSWVKITSCTQYFNRHLLCLHLQQTNCWACVTVNVTLNFNLIVIGYSYTMNLLILSLYVPIEPWIDVLLKSCSYAASCSVSFNIIWCAIVWYRMDFMHRMDLSLEIESPLTSLRLSSQLVGR